MEKENEENCLDWLQKNIIGRNCLFSTPFGEKPLVYSDYTASGRGLYFIEDYVRNILKIYANTHTADDVTGKSMTNLLHEAERKIKEIVNAGEHGKIIFSGAGTTGGISRFQQIIGLFLSSATQRRFFPFLENGTQNEKKIEIKFREYADFIKKNKPVIFIGPYEHHSNELMWRETICDVVRIPLGEDRYFDLQAFERIVSDKKYANRQKIGSFSAASNVTGIKSPVYEIARILHRNNALACFDFAASAPYVKIDMNKDEQSYFDAIFLSPHKFLGGPGSAGILIFNENIYNKNLPPSVPSGGTVNFVSPFTELYVNDIENREKPGTPGILQAIRAALVFMVKEKVGQSTIDNIKKNYINSFYDEFGNDPNITIYSPPDPKRTVGIISFNIKHKDKIFHPKFITKLLNDLFGIQSRAGCSCTGPYAHDILGIDEKASEKCAEYFQRGYLGLKRGWARINLHYSLSSEEFEYIKKALKFVIQNAYLFLPEYSFNVNTGEWKHKQEQNIPNIFNLEIEEVLNPNNYDKISTENCEVDFDKYLNQAEQIAKEVKMKNEEYELCKFDDDLEEMVYFYVCKNNLKKDFQ